MIEPMESRRLMAASSYLDTSFNATGVSTLSFRTSASDPAIVDTQLVSGPGFYVMARTKQTVQVRQLDANGTPRTTFGKNGILTLPLAEGADAEIASDAVGNLVLLAGRDVYRFDGQGKTINPNFASGGKLTLKDFSGDIDMSLDADNKLYFTGRTKGGNGLLVERFISRGRADSTFGGDGSVLVPVVSAVRKLSGGGDGLLVRAFSGENTSSTDDDFVIVAGEIRAKGYGNGVQVARLNYDGSLATTYGKNSSGVASVLGPQTTDRIEGAIVPTGIVNGGGVVIEAKQIFHGDRRDDVTRYGGAFSATGTRAGSGSLLDLIDSADDTGGGFIALQSAGTINVNTPKYVGPLAAKGVISRVSSENVPGATLSDAGQPLTGVSSIATGGQDDDGLILYTAGVGRRANTLNVAKYLPAFLSPQA